MYLLGKNYIFKTCGHKNVIDSCDIYEGKYYESHLHCFPPKYILHQFISLGRDIPVLT